MHGPSEHLIHHTTFSTVSQSFRWSASEIKPLHCVKLSVLAGLEISEYTGQSQWETIVQ